MNFEDYLYGVKIQPSDFSVSTIASKHTSVSPLMSYLSATVPCPKVSREARTFLFSFPTVGSFQGLGERNEQNLLRLMEFPFKVMKMFWIK